jgi:hypothetical protein
MSEIANLLYSSFVAWTPVMLQRHHLPVKVGVTLI